MNGRTGAGGESPFHRLGLLHGIGRCPVGLAAYVGAMALLILLSHARTDPAAWSDYPFLTPWFLIWWVFFPLAGGVWVRSWWWVPAAWLGPLLLNPVEPHLMGEQAAAFIPFGAFFTALIGSIVAKSRNRRSRHSDQRCAGG